MAKTLETLSAGSAPSPRVLLPPQAPWCLLYHSFSACPAQGAPGGLSVLVSWGAEGKEERNWLLRCGFEGGQVRKVARRLPTESEHLVEDRDSVCLFATREQGALDVSCRNGYKPSKCDVNVSSLPSRDFPGCLKPAGCDSEARGGLALLRYVNRHSSFPGSVLQGGRSPWSPGKPGPHGHHLPAFPRARR